MMEKKYNGINLGGTTAKIGVVTKQGLYAGCRRNEALDLSWDDIDMEEGTVTFQKTKSGKGRMVPFNGVLKEILQKVDRTREKPFPFLPDFVTHKFKIYLMETELRISNKKVMAHFGQVNEHGIKSK